MSQGRWVIEVHVGEEEGEEYGEDEEAWEGGGLRSRETTLLLFEVRRLAVARPRPPEPPVMITFLLWGGL